MSHSSLGAVILCGESFAGKYLPHIAHYVYTKKQAGESVINLRGVAMGNGVMNPTIQVPSTVDFALYHGLIDFQQHKNMQPEIQKCLGVLHKNETITAYRVCNNIVDEVNTPNTCIPSILS